MEKEDFELNEDTLEEYLKKDASFVEYFNSFLTLQSFPKRLFFNSQRCQFEEFYNTLVTIANNDIEVTKSNDAKKCSSFYRNIKPQNQTQINYYLKILDRTQGIQWIKRYRLPLFLESEIYADYRLSCQLRIHQGEFIARLQLDGFDNIPEIKSNNHQSSDELISTQEMEVRIWPHEDHEADCDNSFYDNFYTLKERIPFTYDENFSLRDDCISARSSSEKSTNSIHNPLSIIDVVEDKASVTELLQIIDQYPVDISEKQSLDAFKEFLYNTEGEKNILLWLEVERLSRCSNSTQIRGLIQIKDRFFRAGSPFEINIAIRRKWGLKDVSELCFEKLIQIKDNIMEPLLNYWCYRFTIHQLRQKKVSLESTAIRTYNSHYSKRKDLPQRPLSCLNQLKSTYNLGNASTDNHYLKSESFLDNSITRKKVRSISPYARLLSSPITRNTNVRYEQLEHVTNSYDGGFGYKPPKRKYYHNDAANTDHRDNVRLYINPIPSPSSSFSTISNVQRFNNIHDDMDSLVNGLLHEKHMGLCFYKCLQKAQCKEWIDCYMFWSELQVFHECFFAYAFNQFIVKRKANHIFSSYIAKDSQHDIKCSEQQRNDIIQHLDFPFEDLFDTIEKVVLTTLLKPWLEFNTSENYYYEAIKIEKEMKFVELCSTKQRYKQTLDKDIGEMKQYDEEEDDESDGKFSISDIEDPSLNKLEFSFDELLRSKSDMQFFQSFLEENHEEGLQDLAAWTDIEIFRRLPTVESAEINESREKKLQEIREKWLSQNYLLGPNSPATKKGIDKIIEMVGGKSVFLERPSTAVILEVQKFIHARIERKWLILFTETEGYNERKKEKSDLNEIVEDLIMKKKIQRSEHAWKLLNSSANTNTYDVASFRITLNDPIQCELFRRFIRLKGELMENDLKFWLEVQKYKKLCHHHVNVTIVEQKLHTIIDVFIKSQIPPEIQIDVPIEIAERLYDKACGRFPQGGPYLFREAQSAVFRIMFSYWKEFMKYCNELSDNEKLNQSLNEMEKQRKLDIECQKLNYQRSRLNKLVNDQRKHEIMLKEREQLKRPSILSFVSKQSSTDGPDNGEPTFLYSRHIAAKEMQSMENIMKKQGIAIKDDEDVLKYSSMKRHELSNFLNRRKSIISTQSQVSSNDQRITQRCHINYLTTPGTMEKKKHSLGVASYKNLETLHEKSNDISTVDSHSYASRRRVSLPEKYRKSSSTKLSASQSKHENDSDNRNNKNKALSPLNGRKQSVFKQRNELVKENPGSRLTRKLLKDFEKSPEGKPFDVPIPLVRITDFETPLKIPLIGSVKSNPVPSKQSKSYSEKKKLPRNAGTATMIAKTNREEKKERRDSSSSQVVPEVVVC